MKPILAFLIILILLGRNAYGKTPPNKEYVVVAKLENTTKTKEVEAIKRATKGSPAYAYAEDFWVASDMFRLDFRVLLSLGSLESSLFRHDSCAPDMANGFGYRSNKVCFRNYKEAIFFVARFFQTDKRYTKHADLKTKLCVWNTGRAVNNCPYALKAMRLINKF